MSTGQVFDGQAVEYRLDSERGWRINLDDLQSKLNDKVKIIVLVNPNNPTGGIVREQDISVGGIPRMDRLCRLINEEHDNALVTGELNSLSQKRLLVLYFS